MNTNQMSRRREERHTEIDTVKVGIDRPVDAQVLNISKNGICVETDIYLEKGQHHYIYPTISTSILEKSYYGEVRWRQSISDSFSGRFRYGIFFSPLNWNRAVSANSSRYLDIS